MSANGNDGFRAFYAACDSAHREFFSALIADWREVGQPCDAAGGGVRLRIRSLAGADDEGLPVFFTLNPASGIDPARMCLDFDRWRDRLREEDLDRLLRALKSLDGVALVERRGRLCIESPGNLSGPAQHALRALLRRQAGELQELLGG